MEVADYRPKCRSDGRSHALGAEQGVPCRKELNGRQRMGQRAERAIGSRTRVAWQLAQRAAIAAVVSAAAVAKLVWIRAAGAHVAIRVFSHHTQRRSRPGSERGEAGQ